MSLPTFVALLAVLTVGLPSCVGNRAFPVSAENNAMDIFKGINPAVEWDESNFLTDLSGKFALCKNAGHTGPMHTDKKNKNGQSIDVLIDTGEGSATDAPTVTSYIGSLLQNWRSNPLFSSSISRNDRVGCSVRPGCSRNQFVVACLMSSSRGGPPPTRPPPTRPPPTRPPPTRPPLTRPPPTRPPPTRPRPPPPPPPIDGIQRALAFTPQQYDVAEKVTGNPWDGSHYMENLSGYETDCSMVTSASWDYSKSEQRAARRGLEISGMFAVTENLGSTPDALEKLAFRFKEILSDEIGCSLIPDCMQDHKMYVVVSCLYVTGKIPRN